MRVLIVENDPHFRCRLADRIKEAGYDVSAVDAPQVARMLLSRSGSPWDALITNIALKKAGDGLGVGLQAEETGIPALIVAMHIEVASSTVARAKCKQEPYIKAALDWLLEHAPEAGR